MLSEVVVEESGDDTADLLHEETFPTSLLLGHVQEDVCLLKRHRASQDDDDNTTQVENDHKSHRDQLMFMDKSQKRHRLCEEKKCEEATASNFEDAEGVRFRASHHLRGGMTTAIPQGRRKCEAPRCHRTNPCYNFPGEFHGRYCGSHRLDNMINVRRKLCEGLGCQKQATYNFPGKAGFRFCVTHKLKGMVNLNVTIFCETDGCRKQPSFNFDEAGGRGRFCSTHQLPGMVNVINNRCETLGCFKWPSFNFEGEVRGRYCCKHALDGMVNVVSKKRCEMVGCRKLVVNPSQFCTEHTHTALNDSREQDTVSKNASGFDEDNFSLTSTVIQVPPLSTDSANDVGLSPAGYLLQSDRRCYVSEDCENWPGVNYPGQSRGKNDEMQKKLNIMNKKIKKRCSAEGCQTHPSFNFIDSGGARYCALHKLPGMIDLKNPRCEFDGCNAKSCYNFSGEKKGRLCSLHRLDGMVNVKRRQCEVQGCSTTPGYNYEGERSGRFCCTHKLNDMVDVKNCNYKCETQNCSKQPSYNYAGERKSRFCTTHKVDGMVDVSKRRRCASDGCNKRPVFNFAGESGGCFCYDHKLPGMIDVLSARCEIEGCDLRPNFNFSSKSKGRYCKSHKLEGMVDVRNKKRCEVNGCDKQPSYNFDGMIGCRFCASHKLDGMITQKSNQH